MKLGFLIGYSDARYTMPIEEIQMAERLGYDSVWTAEAYGSDAITPLAFIAAHTKALRLGTSIAQLAARTPAATAMAMQTLDALAGGSRAICGLGLSGPQIVEGWYGQPWGRPYYRMRDYVAIMKKIFARDAPVRHDGPEITLPYHGPGALGIGKPLKSILHTNPNLPIWVGTASEGITRLTAAQADGILPLGFTPATAHIYRQWISEGLARRTDGRSPESFEIQPSVHVNVTDDVSDGLRRMKPHIAHYVGGMGHRDMNFHNDVMVRSGFGDAANAVQELYLAGKREEAVEAVPDEYCDVQGLVGPPKRIRERFQAWVDSGATGLTVLGDDEALRVMADVADLRPRT